MACQSFPLLLSLLVPKTRQQDSYKRDHEEEQEAGAADLPRALPASAIL